MLPFTSAPVTGFDAARALTHVAYLGDATRGGRLSGSPEYDDAARYVADRFHEIGLEPLGDEGTFFEHFTMPLLRAATPPSLEVLGPSARAFRDGVDFTAYVSGRAGGGDATAAVVSAGKGSGAELDQAGVQGRIALIRSSPTGNPVEEAYRRGALGLLIVVDDPTIQFSYLPFPEAATIPVLQVGRAVADAVGNTRVHMRVVTIPLQTVDAYNIVGLLRGSGDDSARAVMVGGHLDGLGRGPDGVVFPGANDNGSGVAITIEVARAMAAHRSDLKRSVVFVAFAGEEEGYLGSRAYVERMSAVPGRAESIVAFLDLDATGCCGNALGASGDDTDLQSRIAAAVRRNGIAVATPRGGSDHLSFRSARVPAVLIQWDDVRLHTPSDTVMTVDERHLRAPGDVVTSVALDIATGR